jgi:hypothetical protein
MAYQVTPAPWKIPFNAAGTGPYAVKVLLSDLLFNKAGASSPSQWKPMLTGSGGFSLPHDVTVYNPAIVKADGTLDATTDMALRQKYGFFVSKVTPDARATRKWVTSADYYAGGYWVYEAGYELELTDATDFTSVATTFNLYVPTDVTSVFYVNGDYYTQSLSIGTEGSTLESSASLILCSRDEAMEATIPGSALIPYTQLRIQCDSTLTEVYELVRFVTGFRVGNSGPNSIIVGTSTDNNASIANDTLNPTINLALQTAEIWLRCAYFADYVNPVDYLQDVAQTSNVQHANIIIGAGSFTRFSRNTVVAPYIPATPPRNDLLSSSAGFTAGSFPIPPVGGTALAATTVRNAPVGWFDPDFEVSAPAGYISVPAQGNVYTSGRIFSPTIDELWTYIKKVVSGRSADAGVTQGPAATTTSQVLTTDMRLSAEPALTLGTTIGDPLSTDGSSFINAPEGIVYAVNTSLQYMAAKTYSDFASFQPFAVHSAAVANISTKGRIAAGALQASGDWAPRSTPLSLRELEALIQNCQFNLETSFNFVTTRFVETGETTQADVTRVGTLYQLHKGFVKNPDTHEGNTKWTAPPSLAAGASNVAANSTVETYDDDTAYGSTLPASTNYDRMTNHLAQDVYLSAEGQWRYIFDHVRIPVLNETY